MARGSNASQGRTARSSVNDILPPPPTPDPNYKPEKSSLDRLDDYKKALEDSKTTEADWERNIQYQKDGAWQGKLNANLREAIKKLFDKEGGRAARSEGGSRQDDYWSGISKAMNEQSIKDETGRAGDSVHSGHRAAELDGMGLVEKKQHIINATKEEVSKGNLSGDLKTIGRELKVGGTTERFAGGYAINLKVTVPASSPAAKALIEHTRQLNDLARKGNPRDNPNYSSDVRRLREAFDASPAGKEIRKLQSRVSQVYGQFNYTRMNSLDDGYGTNFYGGVRLRFKGEDGSEYDSQGIQWKKGKFE